VEYCQCPTPGSILTYSQPYILCLENTADFILKSLLTLVDNLDGMAERTEKEQWAKEVLLSIQQLVSSGVTLNEIELVAVVQDLLSCTIWELCPAEELASVVNLLLHHIEGQEGCGLFDLVLTLGHQCGCEETRKVCRSWRCTSDSIHTGGQNIASWGIPL